MLAILHSDEPFESQLNIRMRESTFDYVHRLAKMNGMTLQKWFDRLVAEEYERHVVEHAEEMLLENDAAIAAMMADSDEIRAVMSASEMNQQS